MIILKTWSKTPIIPVFFTHAEYMSEKLYYIDTGQVGGVRPRRRYLLHKLSIK